MLCINYNRVYAFTMLRYFSFQSTSYTDCEQKLVKINERPIGMSDSEALRDIQSPNASLI